MKVERVDREVAERRRIVKTHCVKFVNNFLKNGEEGRSKTATITHTQSSVRAIQ